MFQSGLSLQYWGDCVLTAVFLINRTPSKLLQNKTLFEKLNGKVPDYSQIRTFGCQCYGSSSPKQRHKFLPRAKACLFLGYPAGYKLMDLESNKMFISRNVVFHEDIFPLMKKNGSSDMTDFFTSLDSESSDSPHPSPNINTPSPNIHPSSSLKPISDTRTKNPPSYLRDYHCYSTTTQTHHPTSPTLSYSKLSPSYHAYINSISQIPIPTSFAEAQKSKEWGEAVDAEFNAMEASNTWDVTTLPSGKKVVGCRLLYSLKFNANGTLERRKVRLVAKGYTQKEGQDYNETFSPVAKMATVKLLLKVSATKRWFLTQLDISNAFLNGDLEEEIFMKIPEGYAERKGVVFPPKTVLKLNKSIYGLKQASRQWFKKFSSALLDLGLIKAHGDHSLFVKSRNDDFVVVLVYVDDIIIASTSEEATSELIAGLKSYFKLRELGPLKYFLGLEIARTSDGISVCQRKYALDILSATGMLDCKSSYVPMTPNLKTVQD